MTPTLLDRVFAPGGLSVRVQPVFELHGSSRSICYFECLVRGPRGTNLERADVLFSYVRRKHEAARMDRACVAAIADAAAVLPGEAVIGINVDASTLAFDHGFLAFLSAVLARAGRSPAKLVVEIVEHTPPLDVPAFQAALDTLRSWGTSIALDDVGLGHSNYKMILDAHPHFLKVDRYIVSGVHRDPRRADILRSIVGLAASFGARVVAEGIETTADVEAVRAVGVDLVQGYRLMPPVSREFFAESYPVRLADPVPVKVKVGAASPLDTASGDGADDAPSKRGGLPW